MTYQYDTENRLTAVYDQYKLLVASVYDGDGNRAFQLNYNPDAECGYGMNVSGEIFMPEHSQNEDESLTAEGLLFSYISSKTGRTYELTEYVNDTNREYTEILAAYNVNTGVDKESYSYARSMRISKNTFWNEALNLDHDQMSYYLYDGRGSVTATTWCNGMVTNVYQYDPYGQVTYGSTEHEDFYAYNGESYNPNSGLVYLRARYYNANQGRFFQEDTYLGDITDPLTLNRYAYAKNSPLNYVDPSGHVPASMTGGHMPVGTSQTGSRRGAENSVKATQNPAYQGGTLEEEMERAEESGEYKDCVRAVIRSILKNPDADRAIWKVLLPLGDIREDFSAIGDRYLKYIYGIDNVADTKESYQIRMTVYEILWEAEINGVDVNSVTNREIDSLFVPYFSKRVEEAYQITDVVIATFASVAQSKLMEYCQWKVAEQAVESDLGTVEDPIGINKQKILDALKDAPVEYRKNPNTGLMEPYMKQAQITDDYKVILRRDIGDFSHGDLDHWNLEVQTIHGGNMKYDLHLYLGEDGNLLPFNEDDIYIPKKSPFH